MSLLDLLSKDHGVPFHALTPNDALLFVESLRLERAMNPGHATGTKKRRVTLPKPDGATTKPRKGKKTELDRFIATLTPEEKADFFNKLAAATQGATNDNAIEKPTDSTSLSAHSSNPQS
jgi:hypothetical protein